MGFYQELLLPWLCDKAMRNRDLLPLRRRVVGGATGRVLELGAGSGLNFGLYGPEVTEVVAVEPSARLVEMARARAGRPVTFVEAAAEMLPFNDLSFDTVVSTWTMCSIADIARALAEARRVLKPEGRMLFVEHGASPDAGVRRWQDLLTPAWKRIAGGCHLNRPIASLIEDAGFRLEALEKAYVPGPKAMTYMYEGVARSFGVR
ncbi:MAG: class I SAM-dependent methyltransferase [Candidatus Sericytochromatia bacterium]|nr:class I SAM-dependent methyltransferase [Candidatus Tanganyikabacteria bacterium]